MNKCPNPNCFADDNTSCAEGHLHLDACPKWRGISDTEEANAADSELMLLPWSGLAMGGTDLNFITGKVKPITVGILGPENAGKTTILGAIYLLLSRAELTSKAYTFSNSYTLAGWEAVATNLRWQPGQPPGFPAHTPSRASRAPGLLHLAFRREDGALRDFLFADAPGEWFQKWAVNQQATEAEGARWIARHADVILLIADRQALSGSKMGSARNEFQLLAKRALAEAHGRPLALVWTKGDVEVVPAMQATIRKAVSAHSPDTPEFTVSVYPLAETGAAEGFRKLFDWIISTRRASVDLPTTETTSHDPFFRFGRR